MTAAHCLTGRSSGGLKVVVGDHDTTVTTDTASSVVHDVAELKIHESYNSDTNKNDIALIRLTKPIAYNENVGPVCLPWGREQETFENKKVILTGWGTTEFGGPMSKKLQKVTLDVTPQSRCKADYPYSDSTMLCTYTLDKDTCQVII